MRMTKRFAVSALVVPLFVIAACLIASDANAQSTVVLVGQAVPGVELSQRNRVALFGGDTADIIRVKEFSLSWTHNLKTYTVSAKLPLAGDWLMAEISNDSATGSASLKLRECGLNKSGSYELIGESPVFTINPGGKITSAYTGTPFEMFMAVPEALDPFMHLVVSGASPWWCGYAWDLLNNAAHGDLTTQQNETWLYIMDNYSKYCSAHMPYVANR